MRNETTEAAGLALVSVVSESDAARAVMAHAGEALGRFGVAWRDDAVAGRDGLPAIVAAAEAAGARVFVVASDSADPLAAAVARLTVWPVLGVPLEGAGLGPLESLHASARAGPPVAVLAIGKAGAVNAGLLAVAILANGRPELAEKLEAFRAEQTARVLGDVLE